MITVYTPYPTTRLHYVLGVLFKDQYQLTNELEFFKAAIGAKINYSPESIADDCFRITPIGLLEEKHIRQQTISCFQWEGLTTFFATEGDIPFDLFSASFYLLTRYEEYLPHETDVYGRYHHTESVAWKNNFLRQPLVQLWMGVLNKKISLRFPSYTLPNSQFSFIPSYDIDIAYCIRQQSVLKNIATFLKNIFQVKLDQLWLQMKVLLGLTDDPFDIYDWLDTLHNKYKLHPMYFFLLANKNSKYDKNISAKLLKDLVSRHAAKYEIGLHPSWRSRDIPTLLQSEKKVLEGYTKKFAIQSRQHYLRFVLPQYYRQLINTGIEHDYSMGYGLVNGFRASYADPYYWYDIEQESITPLKVHPFCFMDATAIFQEEHNPESAYLLLKELYEVVKSINGTCVIVLHNHFLTTQADRKAWREAYASFLYEVAINH